MAFHFEVFYLKLSNLSRSFVLTAVGNNFMLHTIYTYHTFPFVYFWCTWKVRAISLLFCYLRNIKNVFYNLPSFAQGFKYLQVIWAPESLIITGDCVLQDAGESLGYLMPKIPKCQNT